MRRKYKILVSLLLCITLFLSSIQMHQVSATEVSGDTQTGSSTDEGSPKTSENEPITEDEIDQEEKASKEEALGEILGLNPFDLEEPVTEKPIYPDTTYQKYFSFGSDRVLKGIFSSSALYFSIPKYWDTKFVYAQIEYDTSKLITDEVPASLTFLVNNTPVYSCNVSYLGGKTQLAYVTIPVDILKEGFNSLEVVSYVRVYETEGCSEDQSWANWINIRENSYIYAGYELVDYENRISNYPYPFISTANPSGEGTAILVSDQASNGEMAAAMYLMADISRETGDENLISVGLYKDADLNTIKNRIIVSTTDNLAEELQYLLKQDINNNSSDAPFEDLTDRVMIRSVKDINGNPLLLIVSDEDENLMEAVNMLLDKERLSQEKLSTTFVKKDSSNDVIESKMLSQLVVENYLIEDIYGSGITFVGPFHNEEILYLPFGNDYVLSSSGKISLKFRYSENLDFNRSLITVYWGDVPVASKKLSKEYAKGDELTFTMPSDVVGTSVSSIKIAFDLEIPELFCTMRQDEMPLAYITGDSVLYLPSRENTKLSFDYFPSPFQNHGFFTDTMIITSDNPDSAELNLLGKVIALYGYGVSPYGNLKVIRASEFSIEDSDYHIITVGTPTTNSFLSNINDKLYFPYNETKDAFLSNSRLVLSDHYAGTIAAFQLLKSPYANERAVLAVSGTDQTTLDQALHFLESKTKRWELKGDCILLDPDLEVKSFKFLDEENNGSKPKLNEFLKENRQPVLFTIIAVATMGMLLLSAVLILIRSRRMEKKEDSES